MKKGKKRKVDLTKKQEKQQQCQEFKAAEQEEKKCSAEKKEQDQPTVENKNPEEGKSDDILKQVFWVIVGAICFILIVKVTCYVRDVFDKAEKYEQYAAKNEELRDQKEQLENVQRFLKRSDIFQEIKYTKINGKEVLFANILLPEEMSTDKYIQTPMFLNLSEKMKRDTKLYVRFSGMKENWTLDRIDHDNGKSVPFIPYREENDTYYYWELSTSLLSDTYYIQFNPNNGEGPYYLVLWWPGN